MDHDAETRLYDAEHFARHVGDSMVAVARLVGDRGEQDFDLRRVTPYISRATQCDVEALLYVTATLFRAAKWAADDIRGITPKYVAAALTADLG